MVAVDVGYDSGKKIHGRKRHLTVDLLEKWKTVKNHASRLTITDQGDIDKSFRSFG